MLKAILLLVLSVTITRPVFDGVQVVTGTANSGETVTVSAIQDPMQVYEVQAEESGVWHANLDLEPGWIVQAMGGDGVDYAIVEQSRGRVFMPVIAGN